MKPYLATRDGVTIEQEGPALISSMAMDLVAASCASIDIANVEDERDTIRWLQAAGWCWHIIKRHLDEARELAQQHLVTACMVQA